MSLVELLNEIGARNAVGRVDLVENRFVGIKSRGCYETPGGTLLIAAHRELEALCLERDVAHFKQHIGLKYAELVYFGLWFTPLREALDAFVEKTQKEMTGISDPVALQGQRFRREPRVGAFAVSNRSVVVHDGRELRPERRGRDSSAFWGCRRGRGRGRGSRLRDEDVVGTVPAAAGSGIRALAAVVRLRPTPAAVRTCGQRRARARAEECRDIVGDELISILQGLEQIGEAGCGVAGVPRG